ncbi:uncharacterized protein LOC131639469 [Vicia villosa]|uniref:uncharacterized protein LOC131639469 n=1 Tax=Vicia villosa TaxID=3911 RepID=UPI00273AB004|nr:uncharacterized protein LOC131639469 [Vicia villosa]
MITKGRADFFLIQETKLKHFDESMVRSLWGEDGMDFSFSDSEGLSGGLLTIWRTETVRVVASFSGQGWRVDYRGDFNAVKKRSERCGLSSRSCNVEWREFSDFIDETGLVDVPSKGKRFSWFSGDGKSKSRIDRFLISNNIILSWGVVGQWIGMRDVSDHCPVWLMVDKEDWGPKPFKFNNEWFKDKTFLDFVKKEWEGFTVHGRGDFVLKEKLRLLKERLKWWEKMFLEG